MKKYLISIIIVFFVLLAVFVNSYAEYEELEYSVKKAYAEFKKENYKEVQDICHKVIELYKDEAIRQQDSLVEYPWMSVEEIYKKWALNDVGMCHYLEAEAYLIQGDALNAEIYFNELLDNYKFAQYVIEEGVVFKPAEEASSYFQENEMKKKFTPKK